ncbi:MAG: ferredoxin:thioredoxin reductase [Deltaproteobacteria bacterium]|nr:ferredoxin:thioredoxin reductase [Deltaproteobacteria bacterium]
MNAEQLRNALAKVQEPKGYYFNVDDKMVMPLMESLLINKERYGYMACPCRLATGDYETDRDIICPCEYREPDVQEFGACFCGLYVSKAVRDGQEKIRDVPERRDPERALAALGL